MKEMLNTWIFSKCRNKTHSVNESSWIVVRTVHTPSLSINVLVVVCIKCDQGWCAEYMSSVK